MEKISFNASELNVMATLESGQIFRYETEGDGVAFVFDGGEAAKLITRGSAVEAVCTDASYFNGFFNMKLSLTDCLVKADDEIARRACLAAKGLRVLKRDKFQTLIEFIISANNNIPRIRRSVAQIAEKYGKQKDLDGKRYFAFPTAEELSRATEEELKALGTGYRAPYIVKTARAVRDGFDLEGVNELDTLSANKKLRELMGVGEKVADCILLFAYGKYDAFPVDTWIEKLYTDEYGGKENTSRSAIRKFFVDKYGDYAGIIQQYLFFYKRTNG